MPVTYDFHERVAVVTGGARGIGRAIAERLRDAGANVLVWDLLTPRYSGVSFAQMDVSDRSAIGRALTDLVDAGGKLDILVNNAGYVGPSTSVLDFDPVEWRRSVDVNLVSFYEVCRQVLPLMKQSACGRIVNMASVAGKEGSPYRSAYAAAKAGVIAFTKSLGKELAETSIRVNAIAPGVIDTEILHQMSPEDVRGMLQKCPMKRPGTVEEVAALAMWLCSEDCSFCTGATFDVSGGRAVF
jgi:3-oxoacyl-[acyl-carrier protein] reductase